MPKTLSPEVFEKVRQATRFAAAIHAILQTIASRQEGFITTKGATALSPELAESVDDCLQDLVTAHRSMVNVEAHFLKETRWICPDEP